MNAEPTPPPSDKRLRPYTVTLTIADGYARLEIRRPPDYPVGIWPALIDALADRWGSCGNQDGTVLWAELDWQPHLRP
jgi:hypothetical protein